MAPMLVACNEPSCLNPALARGKCSQHYKLLMIELEETPTCSIEGCEKPAFARTWCDMHYRRWRRTGNVGASDPKKLYGLSADDLFARHVSPQADGCMIWTGALTTTGYGWVCIDGKSQGAHRVSWERSHGRTLGEGEWVLHRCDNPPCVNPDHLFLGNARINNADRDSKQRQALGRRNGRAKLTDDEVKRIRYMHRSGEYTQTALAEMFGVGQTAVSKILRGTAWRHLDTAPKATT